MGMPTKNVSIYNNAIKFVNTSHQLLSKDMRVVAIVTNLLLLVACHYPMHKLNNMQKNISNALTFSFLLEYVFMQQIEDFYSIAHIAIFVLILIFNTFSKHSEITGMCGASFMTGLIACLAIKEYDIAVFATGIAVGMTLGYYTTNKNTIKAYNNT